MRKLVLFDGSQRGFKIVKLCVILSLPIFLTDIETLDAHTIVSDYEVKPISLPGANGVIVLDHLAYDRARGKLWVPASNTGNVDVIDESTDAASQISGFNTDEVELEGHKVRLGPTAVSIGDGVAYIGNRGNSTLSIIDLQTLERGESLQMTPASAETGGSPHGVVYVATSRELWVTTGPGKSIEVFDASEPRHLKWKLRIPLDGSTEGFAVDNQRGRFYTNIDDMGKTVAIAVRSHKVVSEWDVGSSDLQGLALDTKRGFLFVACQDHVVSLDIGHDGKVTDSVTTGGGLDDIDFSAEQKVLYAAASVTATLTIAEVSDDGKFHVTALVPTAKEARGVIATKGKTAYLIDPAEGRILKLSHR
jgi:DNA-binding beta-propeller fold protein YncE